MAMAAVGGGGGDDEGSGLKCHRLSAGGMWRCNLMAVRGELFCEKHILTVRVCDGDNEVEQTQQTRSEEIEGVWYSGENGGVELSNLHIGWKSSVLDIGEARVVQGSVKKRGRPKGSKNKVKNKEVIVENDVRIPGRKRGRPKGSKNKVKKEVLDDGVTCAEFTGVTDLNGGVKKKVCGGNEGGISVRNRGRPKGSKNKVKMDALGAGITCTDCGGVKDSNDEVKKNVIEVSDGEISIRKRGRPKGSKNKKKSGLQGEAENPVEKMVRGSQNTKKINGRASVTEGSREIVVFYGKDNVRNEFVNEASVSKSFDHGRVKKNVHVIDQRSAMGAKMIRRLPKCSTVKTKARANASCFGGDIDKAVKMELMEATALGKKINVAADSVKDPAKKKKASDVIVKKKRRQLICHQCRKGGELELITCSKCNTRKYCYDCIKEWYPGRTKEEVEQSCPSCCGNCNCEACLKVGGVIMKKEVDSSNRNQRNLYMLEYVLPLLREIRNEEQKELDIESQIRGTKIDEEDIEEAYFEDDDRVYCDNCKASIVNLHRSCPDGRCSLDICLACCNELRSDIRPGGLDVPSTTEFEEWEAGEDGSIPCPPESLGGCGARNLELRRFVHASGVKLLIKTAENLISDYQLALDFSSGCSLCSDFSSDHDGASFSDMRRAASRKCDQDNFLYCPFATNLGDAEFAHFQMHWKKGEPVIVRNAGATACGLSWEPNVIQKAFNAVARKLMKGAATVKAIDCMDWCEFEISIDEFFIGYSEVSGLQNGKGRILKLIDWPPANSFEECFPRYCAEFLAMLPFTDCTHPRLGSLNLACKLPEGAAKPDLGPKIYIAYGHSEDPGRGESVAKLHCDVSDAVNILMHAVKQSTQNGKCSSGLGNGAAIWDIFRREDIAKLTEYLLKHHKEFRHFKNLPLDQVLHPIHDQTFYLDDIHKRQLKEEFDIEPWTFEQHPGEAVFIPAGCPHQVKNIQSCTKVAMDFVSPESIEECIRLTQEFRLLPRGHSSKQDILEVKKLVVSAARAAVSEIQKSTDFHLVV